MARNCDYRTDRQTAKDGWTDTRQSEHYAPLCFAGDTKTEENNIEIHQTECVFQMGLKHLFKLRTRPIIFDLERHYYCKRLQYLLLMI